MSNYILGYAVERDLDTIWEYISPMMREALDKILRRNPERVPDPRRRDDRPGTIRPRSFTQ